LRRFNNLFLAARLHFRKAQDGSSSARNEDKKMKKTLFATLFGMTAVVATSAFAQDPYSMGGGVGAPAYDQNNAVYDQSQAAYNQQAYDQQAYDPQAYGQQVAYAQQAQYPVQSPGYGAYGAPQTVYTAPVCGAGSVWIDGYYDANGYYVNGYCAVLPFSDAYWIAPRFYGGHWYAGYWGHRGFGYAPSYGFRGGYSGGYVNRGFENRGFENRGFSAAPRANVAPRGNVAPNVGSGFNNGFRAPSAPSFHGQSAAPSFRAPSGGSFNSGRSSGGFSGGRSSGGFSGSSHSGGSSHGGRR
jgi:hypothetical protein